MKTIYQIILEMNFQKKDWDKLKYISPVINALCTNKSIRLGKKGEQVFELTPEMNEYFASEFAKLKNNYELDDVNKILKTYGLRWSKLFKGDFSGYADGTSANKGIAFELEYVSRFKDIYSNGLAQFLNRDVDEVSNYDIKHFGSANEKRPLQFKGNHIYVGTNKFKTIGDTIKDVIVTDLNNKEIYLSLKYSDDVSFCNSGISTLFPIESFTEYKRNLKNDIKAQYQCEREGFKLLDFLGIDPNRFANVFLNYNKDSNVRKSIKDEVDVTENAKTPEFKDFLMSVIGCGYVLMHNDKTGMHYYDLSDEPKLNKFIGSIKKMTVLYPTDGNKKSVDVVLETSNLKITFNLRSRTGGIYPDSLLAYYKSIK